MISLVKTLVEGFVQGVEADETSWRLCGTPLKTVLRLRYLNPDDSESRGIVDVRYFDESALFGRCRTAGVDRELRYGRIISCHDINRSADVANIYEHLLCLYACTPEHSFDSVTEKYRDALRSLLYIMEVSGYQQHQVVQGITTLCQQWSLDERIGTLQGARFYLRHRGADFQAFSRTAGKISYGLGREQKTHFLKIATQAATRFGPTNLLSREALKYLGALFEKSEIAVGTASGTQHSLILARAGGHERRGIP